MKKIASLCAAIMALWVISSCDGKIEQHYTAIAYPQVESVLYADQTEDSLCFISYDSWYVVLNSDWVTVEDDHKQGVVPTGYYIEKCVPLNFAVNNTGKTRSTIVNLTAHEGILSVAYRQMYYLNITNPLRKNEAFELVDSSYVVQDSIVFYANGLWNLKFVGERPSWIKWTDGYPVSGRKGPQKVKFDMEKNANEEERTVTIRLTSNGVSDDIVIKQLPPKKENENKQ